MPLATPLAYTSPSFLPDTFLNTVYKEISADTTTTSGSFVDLLSVSITTGVNYILIFSSLCASMIGGSDEVNWQITVDSVAKRGGGNRTYANLPESTGWMIYRMAVTGAAHTVALQWRVTGSDTAQVRVSTGWEHAFLMVAEVTI